MKSRRRRIVLVGLVLALGLSAAAEAGKRNRKAYRRAAGGIAPHPDQLAFKELSYVAPNRTAFRHQLSNGVTVYVVPDHALPLVDVQITARGGSYLDPRGKEGLSAATADQMRAGGAGELDPEAYDEELDFLAINMGLSSGDRESSASINVLRQNLNAGLDLLFSALRAPRFDAQRFELYQKQLRQNLERRNDATPAIESREWFRLQYGPEHWESAQVTGASLDGLSRKDLQDFHRRLWHPGNLIVAVSGDVEPKDILPRLEERMKGWAVGESLPPAAPSTYRPPAGVFVVDKADVNQTRVSIGHRSTTWDDPDAIPIEIINRIFGGGGFTSRITRRVRSDEGLAYSVGSGWGLGRDYPRSFRAGFQSKNMSVPMATAIVVEELERMRSEPVAADELETAISYFVESFPNRFSSASAKASTFVEDEIWGRPPGYWAEYRPKVQKVTAAEVLRVAKERLHPDQLTILVVGKLSEVLPGDPDHPEHRLEAFAGDQGIMEIALPEPLSLRYPHPPRPLLAEAAVESGMDG